MTVESRHISTVIARPPRDVYEFARHAPNLPRWASGLAGSEVTQAGDRWVTDSPMGRVGFKFAAANEFGVLDHDVTLPDGSVAPNYFRVLPHPDGAEALFTLRRLGTAEKFARDAQMVSEDLARLKALLEAR